MNSSKAYEIPATLLQEALDCIAQSRSTNDAWSRGKDYNLLVALQHLKEVTKDDGTPVETH